MCVCMYDFYFFFIFLFLNLVFGLDIFKIWSDIYILVGYYCFEICLIYLSRKVIFFIQRYIYILENWVLGIIALKSV